MHIYMLSTRRDSIIIIIIVIITITIIIIIISSSGGSRRTTLSDTPGLAHDFFKRGRRVIIQGGDLCPCGVFLEEESVSGDKHLQL